MKGRYYQLEANTSIYAYFAAHPEPEDNPVVAMPTGTGKAVVIALFIKEVLEAWPTQRLMMLTHVKELIEQNADKLRTIWPQAPLGIYSAGLGEKSAHMPITFAGIQSAAKNAKLFGHIDLVLIDECQLVSPNDEASYKKFLSDLREINPRLRVIGYTATPYRLGLGMITDGGVFTDVCYDITSLNAFNRLLDEGYLSPLIPMPTENELDVSGVKQRGGEFIEKDLQTAVVREDLTWKALLEAREKAYDRWHWLVFATGISHVEMIVRMLNHMGISAAGVHSKMDAGVRDDNIERFKAGQIRVLVNADILTTGFDFPALDCIILLRPTSSPVLHVQILGRGTRPFYAPGFDLETLEGRLQAMAASYKQNCLVLDFAGNVQRLGPINDPRIPKKKKGKAGDIPIKLCSHTYDLDATTILERGCGCMNHISARFCVNCKKEFTFEEKITPAASTQALIVRDEPQVEVFEVDRVTYAPHNKMGGIPSLKVSYFCGIRRFTEWICLEHEGSSIQRKAADWWRQRMPGDVPTKIEDAIPLVEDLRKPAKIRVWVNQKYPTILMHLFDEKDVTNG